MSSEKSLLLDLPASASGPGPATGHGETRRAFTLTIFALLGCYGYFHGSGQSNPVASPFTESTVASGIAWWACPDVTTTECAYLTVPRDYANPKANDTVSIFLRKVPSTVPRKDRLGSILINPGGPGGSGSGFAASYGSQLLTLVDGRYDIIGFDPRGVNMTIPPLDCYETEAQGVHSVYKQLLLGMPYDARGPNELSYEAREVSERLHMVKLDALYNATSLACQTQGNKRMLESVSTALVVQDMERIVNALGEDGLNFWGFSYGTILGSTFAAMRPHLVKRMVLDGVADAELYHRDIYQSSANSLVHTQKTLFGFSDACANAGPDRCAFANLHNGKIPTSADLQSRLENLFERLRKQPMPVASSRTGPGILTASTAQLLVFTAMYAPITWPGLAKSIADAEAGDPQPMYDSIFTGYAELVPKKGDENPFNRRIERRATPANTASIMCSDTEPAGSKSLDDYIGFLHKLYKITPIGEWWSMWPGTCKNWNIRPIQRYDGPWSVEDGLKMTRFPILYASLDADPVTPLPAAQKMVNAFGNKSAALLVQEGFGHSTLAHPSLCSAKTFRKYFLYGELPSAGTLCKPEKGFLFPGNGTKQVSNLSMEDKKLWRALERLSETSQDFFRLS